MEKLNKTRAFLTEFIIVILFFSFAAVIAIGLYVEANRKNDESVLLSKASMQAQSVAESIRADNSVYDKEGIYTEYLDENMNIVSEDEATYAQKIIVTAINSGDSAIGTEYQYKIIIVDADSDENVFEISLHKYESREVQ